MVIGLKEITMTNNKTIKQQEFLGRVTRDLDRCITPGEVDRVSDKYRAIDAALREDASRSILKYKFEELVNIYSTKANVFLDYMNKHVLTKFRYAVLTKDKEYINLVGAKTWIDDVYLLGRDWILDPSRYRNERLGVDVTMDILKFIVFKLRESDDSNSVFDRANLSKLEALGWSMYQKLVTKVYRRISLVH